MHNNFLKMDKKVQQLIMQTNIELKKRIVDELKDRKKNKKRKFVGLDFF